MNRVLLLRVMDDKGLCDLSLPTVYTTLAKSSDGRFWTYYNEQPMYYVNLYRYKDVFIFMDSMSKYL